MPQICEGEISNPDLRYGGLPARSNRPMTMLGATEDINVKDTVLAL